MEIKKFKIFEQEISLQKPEETTETTTQSPSTDIVPASATIVAPAVEVTAVAAPATAQPAQQPAEPADESGVDISKYFSKLFEARQIGHIYHLQVRGDMGSHAAHTALDDFYGGLLDLIDEIIEVYQGQYGIIEEYGVIDPKESKKEKMQYFEEFVNFIKVEKKCIKPEDSHLLNLVDEIVAHTYRLLYKLKFNK